MPEKGSFLMEGKFPLRSELEWRKSGEAYTLFNKETQSSVNLDAVSFLVWIQCDGKTSIDRIADVFSIGGDTHNRDIVKAAITGVLEKLTEGDIIRWV